MFFNKILRVGVSRSCSQITLLPPRVLREEGQEVEAGPQRRVRCRTATARGAQDLELPRKPVHPVREGEEGAAERVEAVHWHRSPYEGGDGWRVPHQEHPQVLHLGGTFKAPREDREGAEGVREGTERVSRLQASRFPALLLRVCERPPRRSIER